MTDDQILAQAAGILSRRKDERKAEMQRLYRKYAVKRRNEPHNLGKPKKLEPVETLLLFALERNKYVVEAESPNGSRWHGDATCKHHARGTAIAMMATSRLELLWALWASVSDQDSRTGVVLTEDHLRGSIVHRDLKELTRELRQEAV